MGNSKKQNIYFEVLKLLKNHPCSGPFLEPVDYIGLKLHDYIIRIKQPMDLQTVTEKCKRMEYKSIGAFIADVDLIWSNAFKYNAPESEIYLTT